MNSPLASVVALVASDSPSAEWGTLPLYIFVLVMIGGFIVVATLAAIFELRDPPVATGRSGSLSQTTAVAGGVKQIPLTLVSFWVIRDQFQGEKCVICLGGFEHDYELVVLPICDHKFHSHCLVGWLNLSDTCPICRLRVDVAPVFPIGDAQVENCSIGGDLNSCPPRHTENHCGRCESMN